MEGGWNERRRIVDVNINIYPYPSSDENPTINHKHSSADHAHATPDSDREFPVPHREPTNTQQHKHVNSIKAPRCKQLTVSALTADYVLEQESQRISSASR